MSNHKNLIFFNKEGDCLNFNYNESSDRFEGDILFHENSNDTFKTYGIYTMEKIAPFDFKLPDLLSTKKFQLFNEWGINFYGNTYESQKIDYLEPVNNDPSFKSKWIYGDNFESKFPIGTLIKFDSEFLEFTNLNKMYVVLNSKKDAILILSDIDNKTFENNYEVYYSDSNYWLNKTISGVNAIGVLDYIDPNTFSENLSNWNEKSFYDRYYVGKKLNLVNTDLNDGIVTIKNLELIDLIHFEWTLNKLEMPVGSDLIIEVLLKTDLPMIYNGSIDVDSNSKISINSYDYPEVLKPGVEFKIVGTSLNDIFLTVRPIPNWIEIYDTTYFDLEDQIIYENKIYQCILAHTQSFGDDEIYLGNPKTDIDKWGSPTYIKVVQQTNSEIISNGQIYLTTDKYYYKQPWKDSQAITLASIAEKYQNDFKSLNIELRYSDDDDYLRASLIYPSKYAIINYYYDNIDNEYLIGSEIKKLENLIELEEVIKPQINTNYSENYNYNIIFKDIDEYGFNIRINGMDYPEETYWVYSGPNVDMERTIDKTIRNWINRYYVRLFSLGIIPDLDYIDNYNSQYFNTIRLRTQYPNVPIILEKVLVGSTAEYYIQHSEVLFLDIGPYLNINVNDVDYGVTSSYISDTNVVDVSDTLNKWVNKYYDILILYDIKVDSISNVLKFNFLDPEKRLDFTINTNSLNIPGLDGFIVYKKYTGNNGALIASNEIIIKGLGNNTGYSQSSIQSALPFNQSGFYTGMAFSLNNTIWPLMNREFNILSLDEGSLVLSYEGPFWETSKDVCQSSPFLSISFNDGFSATSCGPEDNNSFTIEDIILNNPYSLEWTSGSYSVNSMEESNIILDFKFNWIGVESPSYSQYKSIAFGNNVFVSCDFGANIIHSQDGIIWNESVDYSNIQTLYRVIFANDKFYALYFSDTDKLSYSYDGVTWYDIILPKSSRWRSIKWDNGTYLLIGVGSLLYSSDGLNWIDLNLPLSSTWFNISIISEDPIAFSNNKAVVLSSGGISYSEGGLIWNYQSNFGGYQSIAYGNNIFLAINGTQNYIYSLDGINWNTGTLPIDNDWRFVRYLNDMFIIGCVDVNNNQKVLMSSNGMDWFIKTFPSQEVSLQDITYGLDKLVLVTQNSNEDKSQIYYSNLPLIGFNGLVDIIYLDVSENIYLLGNNLIVLDSITNQYLKSIDLSQSNFGKKIIYNTKNGYLYCLTDTSLNIINPLTNELYKTLILDSEPYDFEINQSNGDVCVDYISEPKIDIWSSTNFNLANYTLDSNSQIWPSGVSINSFKKMVYDEYNKNICITTDSEYLIRVLIDGQMMEYNIPNLDPDVIFYEPIGETLLLYNGSDIVRADFDGNYESIPINGKPYSWKVNTKTDNIIISDISNYISYLDPINNEIESYSIGEWGNLEFNDTTGDIYLSTNNQNIIIIDSEDLTILHTENFTSNVSKLEFNKSNKSVWGIIPEENTIIEISSIIITNPNSTPINWEENVDNLYGSLNIDYDPGSDIWLKTREYTIMPRENLTGDIQVQYYWTWLNNNIPQFFLYDFSGTQLETGTSYSYIGEKPLPDPVLRRTENRDITKIGLSQYQRTIFDKIEYNLPYIDDNSLDYNSVEPMQVFIGFKSETEGAFASTLLLIKRERHIFSIDSDNETFITMEMLDTENRAIIYLNELSNTYFTNNGLKPGQIISIYLSDITNNEDEYVSLNNSSAFIVEEVYSKEIILGFINEGDFIVNEKTVIENYPNSEQTTYLKLTIEILDREIGRFRVYGQTEEEDERFKIELGNVGKLINPDEVFIFKEYDILEGGIDWSILNRKRKEMLMMKHLIYPYIGSYKSIINAINYFGYNDLQLNEYYRNINSDSKNFLKLFKVEIPDIFDNTVEGWSENDFIKNTYPNENYEETNLFNLTYFITDKTGTNVLNYSLDEIIIKLQGLKYWLKRNIIPLTHKIQDITGVSYLNSSYSITHRLRNSKTFNIIQNLCPVTFKMNRAYLMPVNSGSTVYTCNIDFYNIIPDAGSERGILEKPLPYNDIYEKKLPDYFEIKIKTFKTYKEWDPFKIYNIGEYVKYYNKLYVSVIDGNRTKNPRKYETAESWSSTTIYTKSTVVEYNREYYVYRELSEYNNQPPNLDELNWLKVTEWRLSDIKPVQIINEIRKGDNLSTFNFTVDSNIDPYINITVTSDNGYGEIYSDIKNYELKGINDLGKSSVNQIDNLPKLYTNLVKL